MPIYGLRVYGYFLTYAEQFDLRRQDSFIIRHKHSAFRHDAISSKFDISQRNQKDFFASRMVNSWEVQLDDW